MACCSIAHWPKSISLQRSEQKGLKRLRSSQATGRPQVGQLTKRGFAETLMLDRMRWRMAEGRGNRYRETDFSSCQTSLAWSRERGLRFIAAMFILLPPALDAPANPLCRSASRPRFAAFDGLKPAQGGFARFRPMENLLRKQGLKYEGGR